MVATLPASGVRSAALWLTGPRQVEVRETSAAAPGEGEVRIASEVSAISGGTELLVYRGLVPAGMALDANLPALAGGAEFPLRYGYATVGRVELGGPGVGSEWVGRRVLAFHPHESRFVAPVASVVPVPAGMPAERAALLPTLETAVTLLMDGQPSVGERVVVLGQGTVGLAVTALLARLPLVDVITLDRHPRRRAASLALGAAASLDPAAGATRERLATLLAGEAGDAEGADLVFELSGKGEGLDLALDLAGFGARVVVGSWYGSAPVALHLGGRFHRGRARLVASQVSTLGAEHSARWTKRRRLRTALAALGSLPLEGLVTHRFPLALAAEAYALLDRRPEEAIQVLLTYDLAEGASGEGASACTPSP